MDKYAWDDMEVLVLSFYGLKMNILITEAFFFFLTSVGCDNHSCVIVFKYCKNIIASDRNKTEKTSL